MIEPLEARRLLSAAVQTAAARMVGAHLSVHIAHVRHHVSHASTRAARRMGTSQAFASPSISPLAVTGPVTGLTAVRTSATAVGVSFTAPASGTNYTITRSTTLGGSQTTLTPAGGQTATTFTDSSAPTTGNTDYFYTVTSVNGSGSSAPATVFVGHGDGWAADYYTSNTNDPNRNGNSKPLTGDDASAVLAFERIDATINFTGNDTTPPPNTPPGFNAIQTGGNTGDDYAIRWVGYVEAPVTGYYSFAVHGADDKEQIFVYDPNHLTGGNPTPVNISPAGHVMTGFVETYTVPVVGTTAASYLFTAGQKYLVQVDYNQGFGGSVANLFWEASSTTANQSAAVYDAMASQLVPQDDVVAPVPAFATVDASGTVSKDQVYYALTATAGNQSVQLQWKNVAAGSYNLYRSTVQAGPYALAGGSIAAPNNGAPVSYLDSGVTNGTKYYYVLTGVDVGGETAVNLSNGTTAGLTVSATPVATAPATPTGVIVAGTNSTTQGIAVHISFPAVPLASSYIIQRAPESAPGSGTPGTFATVPGGGAVTGAGTISFVDSDPALASNLNYFYRAIAVNSGLQSAASTPVELFAVGPALAAEGTVEVDLRAASYAAGTTSSIVNGGNQGGVFNAVGGAIAVGAVNDTNAVSYKAFKFTGNTASSSFVSPADLNANGSRSIELWVENPTIDNVEESMISWSHRGGPDGSNVSFSYGSQYGMGLWGPEYDLQWTTTAPGVTGTGAPAANTWHYLAFTYDGTNNDVYVDGKLYLQQGVFGAGLSTVAGLPINLAAQNTAGASGFVAAMLGSLDLASVRIEAGALTAADVTSNYVVGVPGRPAAIAAPTTAPTLNPLISNGQLNLTWSYDRNAFSYNVYRSDPAHPTPAAIATGLTSLSYSDTALTVGTTYTYYVTSVNNIGQGPASNTQSGSINLPTTAPTLNPAVAGNNSVTLSWSSDSSASSYSLYRSDSGHPTPAAVATGVKLLTFTDSTAVNGTTYTYYVTSVNSVGEGPHSNTRTATPVAPGPLPPVNILTHHHDAANSGLNAGESVLTPANVNAADFGKQFAAALDGGDVAAQPLYMQNVNITSGANQGVHSVVFVATEADGLYAVDANTGVVLWHDNFTNVTDPTTLTPTTGVSTILQSDINGNPDVGTQLGILATPAIDAATGILYLNANTKEIRGDGKHFVQRLWAVSIHSGAPVMSSALIGDTIAPSGLTTTGPYTYVSGPIVNGTGNNDPTGHPTPVYPDTDGWTAAPGGAAGYVVAFNAIEQMERTAVSLINGSVYLGFASHGDDGPYYGWVLGYNASTLAPNAVFNTVPTFEPPNVVVSSQPFQSEGGIWMSGSNISTDGTYLYLVTGNGAFNPGISNFDANGFPLDHDYGDTVLKLTVDPSSSSSSQNGNGWGLKVADYFTPSNQYQLNALDLDLGSGGATLLPDNLLDAAGNPMLMVGGKESRIYLIDRNNMGKFNTNYPAGASTADPKLYDRVVGEYANNTLNNGTKQIYSSAAYYNGNVYIGVKGTPALELNVANMAAGTVVPIKTTQNFGYPGETFEISSDGTANGVAWALNPGGSDLVAFDAGNFTTSIYDSNTTGGDALGGSIHFHVPMIANGMVYAGSRGGGLGFYGLRLSYLTSNSTYFSAPTGLSAVALSDNDVHLAWTSNSSLATEFRIDRSPHGASTWTTVAYVGNSLSNYDDMAISTHAIYDYRVVAISASNTTTPSSTAVVPPLLPPYITPSGDAVYTYNKSTGNLVVTGGTLTFTQDQATSGDTTDPLVNLTVGSGGSVIFQSDQHLAGLAINGGVASVVTASRKTINAGVFSISGGGKLDIGGNNLVATANTGAIRGYLQTGLTVNLDWSGLGITSSVAIGNPVTYTIGYGDSTDGVTQGLSAGQVLVRNTIYGDATLDGVVDLADFGKLSAGYGMPSGARWVDGDFNYDGLVDLGDFGKLSANYGGSIG